MTNTLQGANTTIAIQTVNYGEIVSMTSVPVGQALLVLVQGSTVTTYSLSATDPAVSSLVKTQIAQKAVV